jgi:hypothetical protein
MQRPMMDPMFVKDLPKVRRPAPAILRWMGRAAVRFGGWLMSDPLAVRKPGEEKKWSIKRVSVRIVVFWSILLPVLLAIVTEGLVFVGTHPKAPPALTDPNGQGVYYDTVDFHSSDGTPLTGWLAPAIDARRVLDLKDHLLHSRSPGIVLVHDFGRSPQQMLPLIRPLHDEGIVVLVVGLRGCGTLSLAGETFGANEANDVLAAVDLLRHSAFVDGDRIAVVGIGSGATATLRAASRDARIKALILANPIRNCPDMIDRRMVLPSRLLGWMRPLCRRVFELEYGVDTAEMNYDRFASVLQSRPTLVFDTGDSFVLNEGTTIDQMKVFCRRHLHPLDVPQLGSAH